MTAAVSPALPRTALVLAALAGAALPDASLFVMWGSAKLEGMPDATIWGELYYSDAWQAAGAVTNSVPLFAAVLGLGVLLRSAAGRRRAVGGALVAFAVGALLHVATDLPLHHDDGHAHFRPFSSWIYASPVSYWDPVHHGRAWSLVEMLIGTALAARLWRRAAGAARPVVPRTELALGLFAYAAGAAYWLATFG